MFPTSAVFRAMAREPARHGIELRSAFLAERTDPQGPLLIVDDHGWVAHQAGIDGIAQADALPVPVDLHGLGLTRLWVILDVRK